MGNISQLCKNCGSSVSGNYCRNCGQSARTGRVNFHYLLHEIQHSIFHVDKGILYTIKELALRPGKTIKDYLDGKRINYFKPLGFVLILGTIYGFVAHFLRIYPEIGIFSVNNQDPAVEKLQQVVLDIVYGHYAFAMLAFLPFSTMACYLVFRKSGYNYWECLIVNSYLTGMHILIGLIFYILHYYLRLDWVYTISYLIIYTYIIWALIQVFNKGSKFITGIKAVLSNVLGFVMTVIIVSIAIIFYLVVKNYFP